MGVPDNCDQVRTSYLDGEPDFSEDSLKINKKFSCFPVSNKGYRASFKEET